MVDAVLAGCVVLVSGCGGLESSVTGEVRVDGELASFGRVAYEPVGGGPMASGRIDEDGRYRLRTNQDTGLAAGEYRVSVTIREPMEFTPGGGLPEPTPLLIPERYARAATSGLRFEVAPGSNVIDLELTTED